MTVPIGSEEGKKPWCFAMNKLNTTLAIIVAVFAIIGAWYAVDCLNIKYFGDTLYAKDSDLVVQKKEQDVKMKQMKSQLNLQQQIRRAESKLERFNTEYQANLLWLNEIRKQYPNKDDMPGETFTQYRKVKKKNEKALKNIEQWEKRRDELEVKELEMMQPQQ